MKLNLSVFRFSNVKSFFNFKERAAQKRFDRNYLPAFAYDKGFSKQDFVSLDPKHTAPSAPHHGAFCPANAITAPVAPKVNLALPPRTHGEYVMRFEHLSAEQRIWCRVNLPKGETAKATQKEILEYAGAPYPSKNTTASSVRVTAAPRNVAEYKATVQQMTLDQFQWCLWNLPGGRVTPRRPGDERDRWFGQPFPLT